MPSMTGIRMSMSTTSGCGRCGELDAVAPSPASPDELEVGLGVDQHPDAGAEQRLVVDERDADRRSCGDLRGARGRAHGSAARHDEQRRARRRRVR